MDLAHTTFESTSISASSLSEFLKRGVLDDYCPFHSRFQIQFLILKRNGGTIWGCYQQALREIAARWTSLQTQNSSSLTFIENQRTDTTQFVLQLSNHVRQEFLRELAYLMGCAIVLKDAIGHLSEGRRNELDFDLWTYRTRLAVCRDLITYGHPRIDTLELLHVVPKSISEDLVKALSCPNGRETLLQWYFSHEVNLPFPPEELTQKLFDSLDFQVCSLE